MLCLIFLSKVYVFSQQEEKMTLAVLYFDNNSIKDKDRINNNKRLVGGSTDVTTLLSKKYGDNQRFEPISKIV